MTNLTCQKRQVVFQIFDCLWADVVKWQHTPIRQRQILLFLGVDFRHPCGTIGIINYIEKEFFTPSMYKPVVKG